MSLRQDGRWPSETGPKPATWEKQAGLMAGGAVAVFLLLAALVPTGLVLPIFSAVALVVGAGIAAFAWYFGRKQQPGQITCWDIASTCVFVGFAAGVMGDPQHVVELSMSLNAAPR